MKKLSLIVLSLSSMFILSGCTPQDRDGWFYETFTKPMDLLLKYIYDIVGSWGVAIVIVTLIMRIIIMPFMLKNYKQQRLARIGQEKAKPELDVIRTKLEELKKEEVRAISKEDKLKVRTAQMELQREQFAVMKKHNANPMSLAGCLPLLIQAPFLTGIYFTLINPLYSSGIVDSTFLGVFNLGTRSYVLPIIAFIVYGIQTKLTLQLMPTNVQPGQEALAEQMKLMQWITPVMLAFISFVTAGAVAVYYIVGGIFLIGQTYLGYKLYPPYKPEKEEKTNFDPNKVTLVSNKKKKK
ncbi:MAG: membrane protein insertase YidC [Gemella sp.]|nr:membrane protein insertase YidC [Gemella sp.]